MSRVLVVSPLRAPDPARDHHGVYQRLRLFIRALAAEHDIVDIAHFAPPSEISAAAEEVAAAASSSFWRARVNVHLLPLELSQRSFWTTLSGVVSLRARGDFRPYLGPAALLRLRELVESRPDAVFAHRLPMMEALRGIDRLPPVLFDLDDVEHLVKGRAADTAPGFRRRVKLRMEASSLAEAERRAVRRAQITFICSDSDRSRLADAGFDVARVAVAPNAVDIPPARPPRSARPNALYIGNYGHAPNAEAAERLITLIWPQVRAILPEARLIIAGADPERIPSYREDPEGVLFTGLVDTLDDLYADAGIVCCPLVNGGGTRVKLIEAASRGLPIVATPVAAEGLALNDGRDILLQQDDVGLAQACISLLTDPARAEAQADAAFRAVARNHQPDHVVGLIRAAIRQISGAGGARVRATRPGAGVTLGGLQTDPVKR